MRRCVPIPLPDAAERAATLRAAATAAALAPPPAALCDALARGMHGLAAADIGAVCAEARLSAARRAAAAAAAEAEPAEATAAVAEAALLSPTEAEWRRAAGAARPGASTKKLTVTFWPYSGPTIEQTATWGGSAKK